jgi:hypothetical protein
MTKMLATPRRGRGRRRRPGRGTGRRRAPLASARARAEQGWETAASLGFWRWAVVARRLSTALERPCWVPACPDRRPFLPGDPDLMGLEHGLGRTCEPSVVEECPRPLDPADGSCTGSQGRWLSTKRKA